MVRGQHFSRLNPGDVPVIPSAAEISNWVSEKKARDFSKIPVFMRKMLMNHEIFKGGPIFIESHRTFSELRKI